MVYSLQSIQELPSDHHLRKPTTLAHAASDYFSATHSNDFISGEYNRTYKTTVQTETGRDVEKRVSGHPMSNGILVRKTGDGLVISDPETAHAPSLSFKIIEGKEGKSTLALSSDSRELSTSLKTAAKEMLSQFGIKEEDAVKMMKEAALWPGSSSKKAFSHDTLEANVGANLGERSSSQGYRNALEARTKQSNTAQVAAQAAVATPSVDTANLDVAPKAVEPAAQTVQAAASAPAAEEKPTYSIKTETAPGVYRVESKPGALPPFMLAPLQKSITEKGLSCQVKDGCLIVEGMTSPAMIESLERNINNTGQKLADARSPSTAAKEAPGASVTTAEQVVARVEQVAQERAYTGDGGNKVLTGRPSDSQQIKVQRGV